MHVCHTASTRWIHPHGSEASITNLCFVGGCSVPVHFRCLFVVVVVILCLCVLFVFYSFVIFSSLCVAVFSELVFFVFIFLSCSEFLLFDVVEFGMSSVDFFLSL